MSTHGPPDEAKTPTSRLKFELYVAGGSPRPAALKRTLSNMIRAITSRQFSLEVIDVLENPSRAETAKVTLTPTLLLRSGGAQRKIVGDPSNKEALQWLIGSMSHLSPVTEVTKKPPPPTLADLFPEALVLLDEQGQVLAANRAGETLLSLKDADSAEPMMRLDLSGQGDNPIAMLHGGAVETLVVPRSWRGSKGYLVTMRPAAEKRANGAADPALPISAGDDQADESAELLRTLSSENEALLESILKLRDQLADLYEQNRRLDARSKELDSFAYSFAHDVRAPLRTIRSAAQLVIAEDADNLSEDSRKYVDIVIDSTSRVSLLLNKTLEYAKATTGSGDFSVVDLARVLKWVVSDLDFDIKKAQATVTIQVSGKIIGNEADLYQVFINLIGNAIKYTRPDTPSVVTVSSELFAATKDRGEATHLRVKVADNGVGFDEAFAARIFAPFTRLGRKGEGAGIGLATVRRIIERHGGAIHVASTPGEGSTFTVDLRRRVTAREG